MCGHESASGPGHMATDAGDRTEARASGAMQEPAPAARAAVAMEKDPAVAAVTGDHTAARAAVSMHGGPEVAPGAGDAAGASRASDPAARAAAPTDWPGIVGMSDMVKGIRKKNKIPTPASLVHKLLCVVLLGVLCAMVLSWLSCVSQSE